MDEVLTRLPWQIQVSLASGYLAYMCAYLGVRQHHSGVDITFLSFVFGLFATATLWEAPSKSHPVIAASAAVTCACIAAIGWRKYLRPVIRKLLHYWNISWSNDDPTAIATLSDNSKFPITKFGLELTDGTWLYCEDPTHFKGAPFNPIIIGQDGSVAVYVTHKEVPGQQRETILSVRDATWGDKITYVPASQIKQITMRHTGGVSS